MLCIWAKRAVKPSVGPELNTGFNCSFGPDAEHGSTQRCHTATSLQWREMEGHHCREACYMRSHVSQIQADLPGPRMSPRVPLHLLPRRMSSARSGVPFSSSRRGKMLSRISQSARALCAWLGAIPKCSLKSCCIVNQSINQSIYSLCLEESYASQQTMIGGSLSMLSLNGTVEANLQLSGANLQLSKR